MTERLDHAFDIGFMESIDLSSKDLHSMGEQPEERGYYWVVHKAFGCIFVAPSLWTGWWWVNVYETERLGWQEIEGGGS